MSLCGFIPGDSDSNLIKSIYDEMLDRDEEIPEELEKALNKTNLVQVQRQVNGKHGMYTRMQWVKTSDVKSTDKVVGGQNPNKDKSDKKGEEKGITVDALLKEVDGEVPTTPNEAYHLVEAADTDFGGLKVGNDLYTIGDNGDINKTSGNKTTKVSADEVFKDITSIKKVKDLFKDIIVAEEDSNVFLINNLSDTQIDKTLKNRGLVVHKTNKGYGFSNEYWAYTSKNPTKSEYILHIYRDKNDNKTYLEIE